MCPSIVKIKKSQEETTMARQRNITPRQMLSAELDDHLGYEKYEAGEKRTRNRRKIKSILMILPLQRKHKNNLQMSFR